MLVYMIYDKKTGQVVHVHRAVDVAGRSCTCTPEEVLRTLPPHLDPKKVDVLSTELDQVPSGRQVAFSVDVASGTLKRATLSGAKK